MISIHHYAGSTGNKENLGQNNWGIVMENIVRLKGDKINLCTFRKDQEALELYTKWMNDESILHFIGRNYRVLSIGEEERYVNKEDSELNPNFNIVEASTDKLIGNCGLHFKIWNRCAILGICIGEPEGRDKGYGTEVIKMLVKFAFEQLNAHRVGLSLNGDNKRALRCYEKAGFRLCGVEHDAGFYDRHYCDVLNMEILEHDYLSDKYKN